MHGFNFRLQRVNGEQGFSLVELMIVVGIIGVLSAMAIPKFQKFQAKARMAEASNMLNHIYTLEESYRLESGTYLDFAGAGHDSSSAATAPASKNCGANAQTDTKTLGLDFTPCSATTPRYEYSVTGSTASAFTGTASSGAAAANLVCPGDPVHTFTINETRTLGFTLSGAAQATPRCN